MQPKDLALFRITNVFHVFFFFFFFDFHLPFLASSSPTLSENNELCKSARQLCSVKMGPSLPLG